MTRGPKKAVITVWPTQRELLERLIRRHHTPQQIAKRARVVLRAVDGTSNRDIGRQIGMNRMQVGLWRKRWIAAFEPLCLIEAEQPDQLEDAILDVLRDAPRSGTPPIFTAEQVVQIVAIACETPQESERPVSHWTPREIKEEAIKRGIVADISEQSVKRFLKSGGS